jgi:iron(III) transport system substrate-binding protein
MAHLTRITLIVFVIAAGFLPTVSMAAELNIYSYRQQHLLKPFLDAYSADTGVEFNVVHAPKGLVQRLQSEGASSPADVILTVDISRLHELSKADLLAPLSSPVIKERIPANLRHDGDTWTALSTRARIIAVSKDRVADGAITRIEDLAKPEWKGKICTRIGSHVYNRALLASLVVHLGEKEAEAWARGLVDNLARKPQGNDRAQASAVYAGECDVALMNTYYLGLMQFNTKNPEQQKWGNSLRVVFFNQDGRGQHVNISGGAIVKTSQRQDEARAFLEWLTSPKAQEIYARSNYEYPANKNVSADDVVAAWGQFKADDISITAIAEASATAQMIIDRVGW